LILKGLLQKIFSALLATSEENREQTIIFRLIGRESREESKRESREESARESIEGKYLRNLFTISINNHQQPLSHLASNGCHQCIIN
jgi:hypothetical protein